ncbi:MAG: SMC family ATPase [Nanoarchaeota archaeon]|nr:SMC family ATPase [Nanoarchaeota archaeon]
MIIKSLELENIRSYKNSTIKFEEGINFLSGDIGSGKSSILQAIEFAFFGFKRVDLEGYQILRKGEKEGSVLLNLESDLKNKKTQIEIYRKLKRGKSKDNVSQENGYLKVDDNLIDLSPNELNSQIFELLNFPKEFIRKDKNLIYRFTIYTPQEQLKDILFAESEKRLELIRKIFNIDKYKQLKDAISIYIATKRDKKISYQTKIENIKENKDELEILAKEIEILKEELNKFKLNAISIKEKKDKYDTAFEKRENYLKEYQNRLMEFEKKLSQIEEIEKNLASLEKEKKEKEEKLNLFSKEKYEKEIKVLNEKKISILKNIEDNLKEKKIVQNTLLNFEKSKKEKEELEKILNEIKHKNQLLLERKKDFDLVLTKCKIKDLENQISSLELKIKKLEKKKEEGDKLEKEILKLSLEFNNIEEKSLLSLKHLENISKIDVCPTCKQEVCESHKKNLSKNYADEIKLLKSKKEKISLEIKNKKEEQKVVNLIIKDFDSSNSSLLSLKENLKLLKVQEIKEIKLNEEFKEMQSKIEALDEKVTKEKLDNINLLLEKEKTLREKLEKFNENEISLRNDLSNFTLAISEKEEGIKNHSNLKEEILKLCDKISRSKIAITNRISINKNIDLLNSMILKFQEEKDKIKILLDKIYEKEKEVLTNLERIKTQKDEKEKYLAEKDKAYKNLQEIEIELKNIIENEIFLSKTVVEISQILERYIFTKYYVEFNEEFERVFRELIEDNEIDVRLDEDFAPIVEQNGYDIDILNLSGGEKSSLALAYRLGLKKIVENNFVAEQKLSLLILDEPTDGFSENQVDRLGELLKSSNLKQIILVSHDQKIESISNNIVEIEKTNHISMIK